MNFRVYDKKRERFYYDSQNGYFDVTQFWLTLRGELTSVTRPNHEISSGNFILQKGSGIPDKKNKEAFQGDILEILYKCGDFAYMDMTEEERAKEDKVGGNKYIVEVAPQMLEPNNLELKTLNKDGSPIFFFPLSYISNGIIIGDTFRGIKE